MSGAKQPSEQRSGVGLRSAIDFQLGTGAPLPATPGRWSGALPDAVMAEFVDALA
jgi:hypothetical protein